MATGCAQAVRRTPCKWLNLHLTGWPGAPYILSGAYRVSPSGRLAASPVTAPIRVLIADDHAMVRSGLAAFLMASDDLELVGEAADGSAAVRECARSRPDVVLMDLVMPGMDGPSAIREIHAAQ